MKQVFSIVCAAFLSMALLVTSCKKGDTGPEGPEGPPGPAGPQGPQGPQGTANVIYSDWLDVTFQEVTAQNGSTFWAAQLDEDNITADIVNKGDVRVFVNVGTPSDPAAVALPLGDLLYIVVPGSIIMQAGDDSGTFIDTDSGEKSWQYRYVIIPGGAQARSAIDWNDYNAVKKYLNIKD